MLFKTLNYIKYDYLRISTKIIIERIKDIPCQKMTGFLSIIAGFFYLNIFYLDDINHI